MMLVTKMIIVMMNTRRKKIVLIMTVMRMFMKERAKRRGERGTDPKKERGKRL